MKDLVENLKQKLLEENIRESYMTLDLAMIFWIQHQKAEAVKAKQTSKHDYIKLKNLLHRKTNNKQNGEANYGRTYFQTI